MPDVIPGDRDEARVTAPRRWLAAIATLTCVALALVAWLVVEAVNGSGGGESNASSTLAVNRSAALQDAIDEAPVLFSYDYRKLDKDLAAARSVTTGAFTAEYDQVSVPAVKPLAVKYKVVVVASVLGGSIVEDSAAGSPVKMKVLLFLNQTVKNSQLAAPRVDANRTVLTMQKVGTSWKVAAVDAI
jgi:Mce-associated membrane protein